MGLALVSRPSKHLPTLEDGSGDSVVRPTTSRPTLRPKTASRTREKFEVCMEGIKKIVKDKMYEKLSLLSLCILPQ